MAFLSNTPLFIVQRAKEALQGHLLLIYHKQKPMEIKAGRGGVRKSS